MSRAFANVAGERAAAQIARVAASARPAWPGGRCCCACRRCRNLDAPAPPAAGAGRARPADRRQPRGAVSPAQRGLAVLWRGEAGRVAGEPGRGCRAVFRRRRGDGGPGGLCVVLDLPEQAETLLRLARASHVPAGTAAPPDPRTPLEAPPPGGAGGRTGWRRRVPLRPPAADLCARPRRAVLAVAGKSGSCRWRNWSRRWSRGGRRAPSRGCSSGSQPRWNGACWRPWRSPANCRVRGRSPGPDRRQHPRAGVFALRCRPCRPPCAARSCSTCGRRTCFPTVAPSVSRATSPHARGYRLLLRGPRPGTARRRAAGTGSGSICCGSAGRRPWLTAPATRLGFEQSRLVLAGADTPEAIAWGQRSLCFAVPGARGGAAARHGGRSGGADGFVMRRRGTRRRQPGGT